MVPARLPRALVAVLLALATAAPAPGSTVASPSRPSAARPASGTAPPVFELPVADGDVARLFAAPVVRWGPGHRGVDLTAAPEGVVRAPADGTVTWVGHVVDRGVLTITHPGGLRTSLEPVTALHPAGTPVRRGEVVAVVEPSGWHCPTACVHWGVRRGPGAPASSWEYVDPLALLASREVRLLPWSG